MNTSKIKSILVNALRIFLGIFVISFLIDMIYMFIKSGGLNVAFSYWINDVFTISKLVIWTIVSIGMGGYLALSNKKV
jgi:hypothetical protein